MKQLEITTNKRLLIVEFPEIPETYKQNGEFLFFKFKKENEYNDGAIRIGFEKIKEICKGSDLTEEIAKGLVHSMNFATEENPDIGYHDSIKDNYWGESALQSFISCIKASGYHWGENPVSLEREKVYREMGDTFKADGILRVWQESESRTFTPEKCIIFEIV